MIRSVAKRSFAVTAVALLFSLPTAAVAAINLEFGSILSPTGVSPSVQNLDFASLSVSQASSGQLQFSMSAGNLATLFGAGAYIGTVYVDYSNAFKSVHVVENSITGTVGAVDVTGNGTNVGGQIAFDFGFKLGDSSDRLRSSDTVSWRVYSENAGGLLESGVRNATVHVQSIASNLRTNFAGESSAWYLAVSPVPEPAEWATMVAGLGVVGWVARRRRARQS